MKKSLVLVVLCAFAIVGCSKNAPPVSDALITTAVSVGTSSGLKFAIKDVGKQHVVAQYLNNYAGALRTITGNPTDEQLTKQLMAFIPPDVQVQYPEISTVAIPMIVSFYDYYRSKYGANTQAFYQKLNDVATGIEQGSACCLH